MRVAPVWIVAFWLMLLTGCPGPEPAEDVPPAPPGPAVPVTPLPETLPEPVDTSAQLDSVTVLVHFTLAESPASVPRSVPATAMPLRAALAEQLRGPTEEEQAAGYSSWFSPATAGMLQRVVLEDGRAVVDFEDFRHIIPGASSSAGSQALLGELNATVFQFPEVNKVLYRFTGDCDLFWEWLQRACQPVYRARD